MKDWFEGLEPREQLFVGVGAAVVAIAVVWGLLWAPLDKRHRSLAQDVADWERALPEMRQYASMPEPQSGARVNGAPAAAGQTPVIIVDSTLRSRGLGQPRRSQPTPNGIRVEFENVAFDDLVLWLNDLSSQYAMEVQAGSFSRAGQPASGRVDATLTLERAL